MSSRSRSFKFDNVTKKIFIAGQVVSDGSTSTPTVSGNLSANTQSNITNVGVLSSLTVTGNISAANYNYANGVSILSGLVANAGSLSGQIVTANTAMKGYVDNGLSSLSSNRINANASNVTVTASFVNVAINSSNVASISSAGISTTGNLTFTGTDNRITGNFGSDNGVMFQTNVTNADTYLRVIPNGTSSNAGIYCFNTTNITDNAVVAITISSTEARLVTGTNLAGTPLPLRFFVNGQNRGAIDTSGNWGIGNTSPAHRLSVNGDIFVGNIVTSSNNIANIGSVSNRFNTVFARATSAQYADLAEVYVSDKNYIPGTVVVFGGDKEVTVSTVSHDPAIAGVVSTNPAYLMNDSVEGVAVALQGRVPCRVLGPVVKGDRVVTSDVRGVAERLDMSKYQPGCIIGKTLGSVPDSEIATIEVVVGRN